MEVSGVRSSWVTESSRAVRRRSVSLAALERALSSSASARSMDMETRPLRPSMVSRERVVASSSTAPLGRTPTRRGMTAGKPSAVEVVTGCSMASRRSWTISARVRSMAGTGRISRVPGDLRTGDALGVGEIDAVAVGEIEGDGGAVEGVGHAGWDEVEELGDVLRLQQLTSEAVEHLGFEAAGVGLVRLLADAGGQVAGVDGGAEEGEEGDPVLGVADGEGADRGKEVVVEEEGCAHARRQWRSAGPSCRRRPAQAEEESARRWYCLPGESGDRELQYRQAQSR